MIPLLHCGPRSPPFFLISSTSSIPVSTIHLTPTSTPARISTQLMKLNDRRRTRRGICLAELSADAPFAIAIGASMLSSLVLPVTSGGSALEGEKEEERDGVIEGDDARFAVMGIISLIPYFNWLSWVFAFMDTGKHRYAVYAVVYLAPYFRSNQSLSPEESWLPIASIVLCIIHVQLEASTSTGDLDGLQFFNEVANRLLSKTGWEGNSFDVHDGIDEEFQGRAKDRINLPSNQEHSRGEIRKWGLPKTPSQDHEREKEDRKEQGKGKH